MTKLTIHEMHSIAKQKGGRCLSTEYINNHTKLLWECSNKHTWEATPKDVKKSSWCGICSNRRPLGIDDMRALAKNKGGKCLSTEYKNNRTKLLWECSRNHRWEASPFHIKNSNSWCPKCAGNEKLSIDVFRETADARGGSCLSSEYKNQDQKLLWECIRGHRWHATPVNVHNNGTWCPRCRSSYSEEICRETFQQIFRKEFPKTRPNWLMGFKGRNLELDGYCADLKVAFEYNGKQHYDIVPHFQKERDLSELKLTDILKTLLCQEQGVQLFTISYRNNLEKLPAWIKKEAQKREMDISDIDFSQPINLENVYKHDYKLRNLQNLASKNGGLCLSTKYVSAKTKLLWQCAQGHTWETAPSNINQGHWCPKCAGNKKLTISEMHSIAKQRGGKCLSTHLKNSETPIKWECAKRHIWYARPNTVKGSSNRKGTWCKKCFHLSRRSSSSNHRKKAE